MLRSTLLRVPQCAVLVTGFPRAWLTQHAILLLHSMLLDVLLRVPHCGVQGTGFAIAELRVLVLLGLSGAITPFASSDKIS